MKHHFFRVLMLYQFFYLCLIPNMADSASISMTPHHGLSTPLGLKANCYSVHDTHSFIYLPCGRHMLPTLPLSTLHTCAHLWRSEALNVSHQNPDLHLNFDVLHVSNGAKMLQTLLWYACYDKHKWWNCVSAIIFMICL